MEIPQNYVNYTTKRAESENQLEISKFIVFKFQNGKCSRRLLNEICIFNSK